jgi:hypothetical protein
MSGIRRVISITTTTATQGAITAFCERMIATG